ncbi:hypothetical protein QOT17_023465 [Balamuthia mandrillaris]
MRRGGWCVAAAAEATGGRCSKSTLSSYGNVEPITALRRGPAGYGFLPYFRPSPFATERQRFVLLCSGFRSYHKRPVPLRLIDQGLNARLQQTAAPLSSPSQHHEKLAQRTNSGPTKTSLLASSAASSPSSLFFLEVMEEAKAARWDEVFSHLHHHLQTEDKEEETDEFLSFFHDLLREAALHQNNMNVAFDLFQMVVPEWQYEEVQRTETQNEKKKRTDKRKEQNEPKEKKDDIEVMSKVKANELTFGIMMHGYRKQQQKDKVLALLQLWKQHSQKLSTAESLQRETEETEERGERYLYTIAIETCVGEGAFEQASRELMTEMRERGIKPTAHMYYLIIDGYAKQQVSASENDKIKEDRKLKRQNRQLLQHMLALLRQMEETDKLKIGVNVLNVVVKSCVKAGQLYEALQLLKRMTSADEVTKVQAPNIATLLPIMEHYAANDKYNDALKLWRTLRSSSRRVFLPPDALIPVLKQFLTQSIFFFFFTSLFLLFLITYALFFLQIDEKAKFVEWFHNLQQQAKDEGIALFTSKTWDDLLNHCVVCKDHQTAFFLLDQMTKESAKQQQQHNSLLKQMIAQTKDKQYFNDDNNDEILSEQSFQAIMAACAASKESGCVSPTELTLADGWYLWNRLLEEGLKPSVKFFNQFLRFASAVHHHHKEVSEGDAAKAHEEERTKVDLELEPAAAVAEVTVMRSILAKMLQENLQPNLHTYNLFLQACLRAKDVEAALYLWQLIKLFRFRPPQRIVVSLQRLLSSQGRSEAALQVLEESKALVNEPLTTATYNAALRACARREAPDEERAAELLRRMKQEDVPRDANSYHAVIQAYSYAGELEEALRVLEEMTNEESLKAKMETFQTILEGWLHLKHQNQQKQHEKAAQAVLERMQAAYKQKPRTLSPRMTKTLSLVAHSFQRLGRPHVAKQLQRTFHLSPSSSS